MQLLVLILSFFIPTNKSINEIRLMYHASINSSDQSKEIVNYFDIKPGITPLEIAYEGASRMVLAKHVLFPTDKLSTFKKGKNLVEEAIKRDPNSNEIRYLRYGLQLESPNFLGYKKNIQEDRKFLINHYNEIQDSDFKLRLKNFLITEANLSIEERKIIK